MGQENTFSANKQFGIRYTMKRKLSERAKSGEMPKAVQRGISARPRFSAQRPSGS